MESENITTSQLCTPKQLVLEVEKPEKQLTAEEAKDEEQKPKQAKKLPRKSSRAGFRMDNCGLRKKFMRANMETKLFIHPCLLRFFVYYHGMIHIHDVYPMDNLSEWAHFRFRAYTNENVPLRVIHRDPEGTYRHVINTVVRREFIGALNCFGGPIPRFESKRFCLRFLPWRPKKFTLLRWIPRGQNRPRRAGI